MARIFFALTAALGARGLAAAAEVPAEVPIYCRLLEVGLGAASFAPILEDLNLSSVAEAPVAGEVDVSVSHAEVGAVRLVSCGASVDEQGRFSIGVSRLDVDIKQLAWQYTQRSWPHAADEGVASANTSLSFNVSIDMARGVHQVFAIHLGEIELDLGARHHPWLAAALEKLARFLRPLVSEVVETAATKALDSSMAEVRRHGACAFLQGSLADLSLVKLAFTSYEPIQTHVPVIGTLNVSVNSTDVTLPTSMRCEHVAFNGTTITAHVSDVPFNASFRWAYQRLGSFSWHNQGNASTKVLAGTLLHLNLMAPSETEIEVELPTLDIALQADAHPWMYKALGKVMGPLIQTSVQAFGGKVLSHFVAKCLADPTCPRLKQGSVGSTTTPPLANMLVV